MTRYLVPIIIFALLVGVFTIGLKRDPSFVPSPLIGKEIPDFELPRLGYPGQVVSDADLHGQISVLNVWATWCVGCRQEHSTLMKIASLGVVPLYGLNWKDDETLARRWLDEFGNPYVATAEDAEGRVAIDWGVYGAPETFLIDQNGIILYRHIAPLTMDTWETEFMPRILSARQSG